MCAEWLFNTKRITRLSVLRGAHNPLMQDRLSQSHFCDRNPLTRVYLGGNVFNHETEGSCEHRLCVGALLRQPVWATPGQLSAWNGCGSDGRGYCGCSGAADQ